MLTLKKVAVTGGLASGKTTVCQFLKKLGAYVVNADEIVHDLLSSSPLIRQHALRIAGLSDTCDPELDRRAIAREVFKDPQKLVQLESLLHPEVFHAIERYYEVAKRDGKYPLFVAEIPLFYESKETPYYDAVVSVVVDPELARKRFSLRGEYPPDEFDRRMKRQLSTETKAQKAHYTLDNSGSLNLLEKHVSELFSLLTSTRGSR